ncbi:MAG: Gfo/Idh/MocA family protein [Kiloniellales bacterium]
MLRAASVGLGWWSDELAKAVQGKSDKLRIVSCYSRSGDKRTAFTETFGCGQHESYEALLKDPGIDAVILTTPHSLHADHVMQAAKAGKHVFVEKPFTLTAESGNHAASACREAGVVLAVGHNRRFSAAGQVIRALLDEGYFGTLLHLEANFSVPSGMAYTDERWRASRIESPGGGLAGLGVHMIDLIAWLGGPVRRVLAQAVRRAVGVDIDDTTSALFELESGATGYLGCSLAAPYTSFLNVYGTKANGFAAIDGDRLELQAVGEQAAPRSLEPVETLRAELEEFAEACAGKASYRVTPAEAIHTVAVMQAIVDSAENRGRAVIVTGG